MVAAIVAIVDERKQRAAFSPSSSCHSSSCHRLHPTLQSLGEPPRDILPLGLLRFRIAHRTTGAFLSFSSPDRKRGSFVFSSLSLLLFLPPDSATEDRYQGFGAETFQIPGPGCWTRCLVSPGHYSVAQACCPIGPPRVPPRRRCMLVLRALRDHHQRPSTLVCCVRRPRILVPVNGPFLLQNHDQV